MMLSFISQFFLLGLLASHSVRGECDPVFDDCSGEISVEVSQSRKLPASSVFLCLGASCIKS